MDNLFKFRIKALALIAILLVSAVSASAQIDTVAIIDAGSSGSRLYVYAVNISKKTVDCIYPVSITEVNASRGKELAGIAENKDSVKAFLNDMTAKFPNKGGKLKELYVLATAGMRKEPELKTRPIYNLMKDGDSIFNRYKLQYAMTISGQYEGLYAWIAANYDAKTLPGQQGATGPVHGILEVGGASMQITSFLQSANGHPQTNGIITEKSALPTTSPDDEDTIEHPIYGTLYSKSYIDGGVNAVYESNCVPNLSTVKRYLGTTPVYGLGGTIQGAKKSAVTKGKTFVDYLNGYNEVVPQEESDTHYIENTYYLICVLKQLDLLTDGKIIPQDAGWTKGAAFDIVINKHAPEQFDYRDQK